MRDGAYFFAPPAGSDSGLRPPQGQSRCKNRHHLSLNNIHKLAKQITPFTSYQDTISFLSEPYRSTPVFYWNRLRAPSLGGESGAILDQSRFCGHFFATLPSLWISFHEILRSGLSDVWASYVTLLLCCLTPYLWPCEPEGRSQTRPVERESTLYPFIKYTLVWWVKKL